MLVSLLTLLAEPGLKTDPNWAVKLVGSLKLPHLATVLAGTVKDTVEGSQLHLTGRTLLRKSQYRNWDWIHP